MLRLVVCWNFNKKKEVACTSETLIAVYETTQCHHICLGTSDVGQAAGRLLQLTQRETQSVFMQKLQTVVYFDQTLFFSTLVHVFLSTI